MAKITCTFDFDDIEDCKAFFASKEDIVAPSISLDKLELLIRKNEEVFLKLGKLKTIGFVRDFAGISLKEANHFLNLFLKYPDYIPNPYEEKNR